MGKRLASLLSAPPPTRIRDFGAPVLSRLERAAELREAMRRGQQEWRREHAQVVGWHGADCDEALEIAADIEHLSRLLDRAERKLEEHAAAEALADGSLPETLSAGGELRGTTESRSPANLAEVGSQGAVASPQVQARKAL